ncbi:MAG: transposase [Neisseriaceae bacterium]|nr:transposase [Neisseriaceae bacterium]MBQ9725814.1 transposase [Neisseriaceae bacterium]
MDDKALYNTFVGIDIAKNKFDIAILTKNNQFKHKVFAKNKQGFDEFYQWIMKFSGKKLSIMETTNVFYKDLADFLYDKQLSVVVINPKTMPNFANCLNLLNKTDKSDAKALAEYARMQADKLRLYEPKPEIERELLRKNRQLKHINDMIIKEKIRIQTMKDKDCISISQNIITHLE